jgi:hypothetical protein
VRRAAVEVRQLRDGQSLIHTASLFKSGDSSRAPSAPFASASCTRR